MGKIFSVREEEIAVSGINEMASVSNPKHFFPFQGHTVDVVAGLMPIHHTESKINLLALDRWNWRKASNLGMTESDTFKWDEKYQAWKITGYKAFYMPGSIAIPIVRNRQYFMEIEVLRENDENKYLYWGGCRYDANRSYLAGYGGTYDYSCASNVKPAVGVWTRYTRYYKSGEAASSSGWGTDTEFYAIGGLINYSGANTQVTYIRNIKFGYIDDDDSNSIISSDGVELDKAKTNLISDDSFSPSRTMTKVKVCNIPFEGTDSPPDASADAYIIDNTTNSNTWSGNAYVYTGKMSLSVSAGQSRTLSMWVYVSKDCNANNVWIYLEGSASGSKNYNFNKRGTWQKLEVTAVASADGTYNALFYCGLNGVTDFSTLTGFIAFSHFQLESDRFSSSVLNVGTTRGETRLTIPNLNYQTFSINFDFKPKHLYYKDDSVSSYNVDILDFKDTSTGLHVSLTGYMNLPGPSKTSCAPYLDPEPNASWGAVANWHMHHYIGYEKDKWYNVTIAKSGSAFYVRWIDKTTKNVLVNSTFNAPTSEAETITSDFVMRELHVGGGYGDIWRGALKNLSIFDRLLSLDESKVLASNGKFQTDKVRTTVIERTPYPSRGLYFPLQDTVDSFDGKVVPVQNVEAVKTDGSVFIGDGYTNIANVSSLDGWENTGTGTRGTDIYLPRKFFGVPVHDFFKTTDGDSCILVGNASPVVSTKYYVSLWAWVDVLSGHTCSGLYVREYRSDGNGSIGNLSYNGLTDIRAWPQKQWIKVSTTITTSSNMTALYAGCVYLQNAGSHIHLTAPCIVKADYERPTIVGSNNDSYLTYNIQNATSIDWDNGPWTIMYWTKPVATRTGLTSYNLCSVGSNSTSGYLFFGKTISSNRFTLCVKSVGTLTSDLFDPNNYFGLWHFSALRNDGTNIVYKVFGKVGSYTITLSKPSSVLDYVRSGRDLEMGGWDNTSRSNSIYRDLFITKTALSDDAIERTYKTMAKLKDDSIQISKTIKEVL